MKQEWYESTLFLDFIHSNNLVRICNACSPVITPLLCIQYHQMQASACGCSRARWRSFLSWSDSDGGVCLVQRCYAFLIRSAPAWHNPDGDHILTGRTRGNASGAYRSHWRSFGPTGGEGNRSRSWKEDVCSCIKKSWDSIKCWLPTGTSTMGKEGGMKKQSDPTSLAVSVLCGG